MNNILFALTSTQDLMIYPFVICNGASVRRIPETATDAHMYGAGTNKVLCTDIV